MSDLLGNKFHDVCEQALDKWGATAQHVKAIEELSELTKEICKFLNCEDYDYRDLVARLIDEMADVYIMLYQLCLIHNMSDEVNERMLYKLERLESRM